MADLAVPSIFPAVDTAAPVATVRSVAGDGLSVTVDWLEAFVGVVTDVHPGDRIVIGGELRTVVTVDYFTG